MEGRTEGVICITHVNILSWQLCIFSVSYLFQKHMLTHAPLFIWISDLGCKRTSCKTLLFGSGMTLKNETLML